MITAIIIAAGRSSRMGTSKALLPHTDPRTTFVRYLINAFRAGGAGRCLVIGRFGDTELIDEVVASGGEFVPNPDAEAGQLSSLLAVLAYAAADVQVSGILLAPVDVPLIRAATVRQLIELAPESPSEILRATFAGDHGHPVLFKRTVFAELRSADPNIGARAVVRADPDRVLDVAVDDPGVTVDVDTPADYERLFGRPVPSSIRR